MKFSSLGIITRYFRLRLSSSSFFVVLTIFSLTIPISSKAQSDSVQIADTLIQSTPSLFPEGFPPAVASLTAVDNPNDGGGAMLVNWVGVTHASDSLISGYTLLRSTSPSGPFEKVGEAPPAGTSVTDNGVKAGTDYYYRVDVLARAILSDGSFQETSSASPVIGPARSSAQWFNSNRVWALLFLLLIAGAIVMFIRQAKAGANFYIRKIAGLIAVDEAIGRATEMGKKVFFIPGIQDMNDVQTIAGIAVLGRVAQVAAEYGSYLEVPVSKSLVMITARETMKEAYTKVGRGDTYSENQVHFITDEQFAYAAAVDGMISREEPATIFYMGAFFAESLILSEVGNAHGAIQIAGTGEPTQLPFFVAACDYTLLGEELFAASAYLSREPRQLGSLRGQDVGKAIFMIAILIGSLLLTFGLYDLSVIFQVS